MILTAIKNKVKLYLYIVILTLVSGLSIFSYLTYKSKVFYKSEAARYENNQEAYEIMRNAYADESRVLKLSLADLENSNDSLIREIEARKKVSGIKKTQSGSTTVSASTSISAADTSIVKNDKEFKLDTTIRYNEFTKSSIRINKDTLISSININNSIDLYVYPKREYVNKYKTFFSRLLKLDFSKKTVVAYKINNTNDLVRIDKSIVYVVE